ncbi:MAG: signal recognition particle-docking protein FtsY [Verrucomicrobiae bacterium]|nr:signal recognition particle-docking protein FtsY [Verrucomicrobiae bacterium]
MGLFNRFKEGLKKTHQKLFSEIKRILPGSGKLDAASLEELEASLIAADIGVEMATKIVDEIKRLREEKKELRDTEVLAVAKKLLLDSLVNGDHAIHLASQSPTVILVVGVNGTGKTTSVAKLAHHFQQQNKKVLLAACDTFRAAAVEQLQIWGKRLKVEVIHSKYGADPASVAHDAVDAAISRKADVLLIDTAGRLHTKHNLMQELEKVRRVIQKRLPAAPHESLLVLDASTGSNGLNQAREFHKTTVLTGLVVTKLDGTSKGGIVVAIQSELKLPIKFIGLGEKVDDLQPFDAPQFVEAMFAE